MEASEYQRVFRSFGIEAELRRTPWFGQKRIRGMYLNSNKDAGAYLILLPASRLEPDPRLWETLDPRRVQVEDRGYTNVVIREAAGINPAGRIALLRAGIRQLLESGGGIRLDGGTGERRP